MSTDESLRNERESPPNARPGTAPRGGQGLNEPAEGELAGQSP